MTPVRCRSRRWTFSVVSVSLNEKLVSPPTSLYPDRAYIETLLSYGSAAKESQLTGVMWYKDTPGHQDKRTTDNKGFKSRKALTAQSKSVQMMGKLQVHDPSEPMSNKSSFDFVHSHELGCTSAILIGKYHSMCSVAWSADVYSFFAWQVLS
jgi:hypothetical protein